MNLARRDAQRARFRRPLGVAVMAYKAILGLCEIIVGVLLAVPSFDPQATFARLSAEELREDPGDRFVALVSRHLPTLLSRPPATPCWPWRTRPCCSCSCCSCEGGCRAGHAKPGANHI
jgi:hypothetical protein